MKSLRTGITKLLNFLAGVSFIIMVVLTVWQVVTRYVLNNPSSWTEELVSYMFAWMALLGTALVSGDREHMNIPLLTEKMKGTKGGMALEFFSELIAFIFSAVILLFGGIKISALAMGQMTTSLGVPVGIFYYILPICGILNMIYAVLNMIIIVSGRSDKEEK